MRRANRVNYWVRCGGCKREIAVVVEVEGERCRLLPKLLQIVRHDPIAALSLHQKAMEVFNLFWG